MNELLKAYSQALVEKTDDDIIYGCDENAIRWHKSQMIQEIKQMKPRWIPAFLWNCIFKKQRD